MSVSQIQLAKDGKSLSVYWKDGMSKTFSAYLLRQSGLSADALRARIDGREHAPSGDVSIESVDLVGSYAVNIIFSDGYERGIYPWRYLEKLDPDEAPEHPAQAYII